MFELATVDKLLAATNGWTSTSIFPEAPEYLKFKKYLLIYYSISE